MFEDSSRDAVENKGVNRGSNFESRQVRIIAAFIVRLFYLITVVMGTTTGGKTNTTHHRPLEVSSA